MELLLAKILQLQVDSILYPNPLIKLKNNNPFCHENVF